MSYCRFSSDNWKSDVYVYEAKNGIMIHVASNKRVSNDPFPEMPDKWWELPSEEAMEVINREKQWLDNATSVPLGLPHDGESFDRLSFEEAVDTLEMLKLEGYHIPDGVVESLREDGVEG